MPGTLRPRSLTLVAVIAALLAACTPSPTSGPSSPTASAAPASGSILPAPSVPGSTAPVTSASPTTGASPSSVPSPTPLAYVVHSGDTLTSIARTFDTTARSIAYWNRVAYPSLDPDSAAYAPDRIAIGWTLQVWPGRVVDEGNLPPRASPSPPPSPMLPPGPTPAPDGTSVVVSSGPRGGNAVALTFDMGGRLDPALDIVDWLIASGTPASVFPTGETASTTEIGKAVLAQVAAHPDLFAIGNHTWDHPDMTKLDATAIASQLERTEQAILGTAGRSTKPLYRPPYGTQDLASRKAVGSLGWSFTILWDVDTLDWKPIADGGPTADDIVAKVLSRARGGSIVLMHLGGYETLTALPKLVAGLRARGLVPVTLDQMLGL